MSGVVFKSVKRRVKIVTTLGPATSSLEKIKELMFAGMNVARINMSHGSYQDHQHTIENIRQASKELGNREVAILLDLKGPKIRVDKLDAPLELKAGEQWSVGLVSYQKGNFIPTVYDRLVDDCQVGARILFDDGLIVGEVIDKDKDTLKIKIIVGGLLKSNKGINLPDTVVSAPSFTQKDQDDLIFGVQNGIDYVALSFVRTKQDIVTVKRFLEKEKRPLPIIAKIENPQGIQNIDEILEVADAIMIARGDMGVELGNHLVPGIQKMIIRKCNERGLPVITATQMLESMIENVTPTRAEASDVANAIWDGTDAVMLSGETAVGKYPIETISMMDKIVEAAEESPRMRPPVENLDLSDVTDAFMFAASLVSEKISAKRVVSITHSGATCLKLSKFRPKIPVLGVTDSLSVTRKMCLYWGISPFYIKTYGEEEASAALEFEIMNLIKERLNLVAGDKLVVTRGEGPLFKSSESNSLRVVTIKERLVRD